MHHNVIAAIDDADECCDEPLVQLNGGAIVRVPRPLPEALAAIGRSVRGGG